MSSLYAKPKFLSTNYATAFKEKSVAQLYKHRPPYTDEAFNFLLNLTDPPPQRVLDVGCGPGKIARSLVGRVEAIDAVDFSHHMIEEGRQSPNGDHLSLKWICGPVEEVDLNPPYDLITAGISVHWMDWSIVFPRFREVLSDNGYLVFFDIGGSSHPWQEERKRLIIEYSTNQDYIPFRMMNAIENRGIFLKVGEHTTSSIPFEQTITDFIRCDHSRESLCIERMGEKSVQEFDSKLRDILQPYSFNGKVQFEISTRLIWGKIA